MDALPRVRLRRETVPLRLTQKMKMLLRRSEMSEPGNLHHGHCRPL